ncbi:YesL family protein [Ornithinibacillus salinisoli]|uniref:YesL family protein n=1 Tax=Ornithinibacillus salinisoli TaxID=1848459 RepID=A0ABW4VX59_9BACI
MQNYSGFMGGLFNLAEWIMRITITNVLWMISNLPILFIVIMMVLTPSSLAITIMAIPLAILMPLLFFPTVSAVFAMVRDWIMNKDQSSLTMTYWKYVKENYKTSFTYGSVITLAWIVWTIDFYFFYQQNNLLGMVMVLIGLWLFVFTINHFCIRVHFHMTIKESIKNAFFITIGNPLLFLSILIINSLLIYLSFRIWFVFPFFAVAITVFLSFFAFYRFTLKIEEKANSR